MNVPYNTILGEDSRGLLLKYLHAMEIVPLCHITASVSVKTDTFSHKKKWKKAIGSIIVCK